MSLTKEHLLIEIANAQRGAHPETVEQIVGRYWDTLSAERDAANARITELEGIDLACDAAQKHVLLLQKDVETLTAERSRGDAERCGYSGGSMEH